jgi:uncharacterized membrane protein
MVDIHHVASCAAPLDIAFAYIDDYRNTTSWMFGLSKFEPEGPLDHGVGAVFHGTFAVPPVKLSSTVKVTGWEQDSLIAYESIKGFRNWSTWRMSADGPQRTTLDVKFSYELPGGLAGKALGRALEPIVALSIRHTEATLRREIEARHTKR